MRSEAVTVCLFVRGILLLALAARALLLLLLFVNGSRCRLIPTLLLTPPGMAAPAPAPDGAEDVLVVVPLSVSRAA